MQLRLHKCSYGKIRWISVFQTPAKFILVTAHCKQTYSRVTVLRHRKWYSIETKIRQMWGARCALWTVRRTCDASKQIVQICKIIITKGRVSSRQEERFWSARVGFSQYIWIQSCKSKCVVQILEYSWPCVWVLVHDIFGVYECVGAVLCTALYLFSYEYYST